MNTADSSGSNDPAGDEATRLDRLRRLSVLCVGNGGLVQRSGEYLTHRSMAEFLQGLERNVGSVTFCHWLEPNDDPLARTRLEKRGRSRVLPLLPVRGGSVRRNWRAALALLRLCCSVLRSDFVYAYWPGRLAEVAVRIARALGKPYALYLRGGDDREVAAIAPLLARARFVVTAGARLLGAARAHSSRVEAVTPMVAVGVAHLTPPRAIVRAGPLRLLYVGRIEATKGVTELLAAQRLLAARGIATRLTLVGQCEDASMFRDAAGSEEAARVELVGAVTEFERLAAIYRASDVFVLASHSEGFPRVIYEAMTFGLPIVTTFVGGIPSVLSDGRSCLRVEVADARDLAEKIEKLVTQPDLGLRLATEAQGIVRSLMINWRRTHAEQVLHGMVTP